MGFELPTLRLSHMLLQLSQLGVPSSLLLIQVFLEVYSLKKKKKKNYLMPALGSASKTMGN